MTQLGIVSRESPFEWENSPESNHVIEQGRKKQDEELDEMRTTLHEHKRTIGEFPADQLYIARVQADERCSLKGLQELFHRLDLTFGQHFRKEFVLDSVRIDQVRTAHSMNHQTHAPYSTRVTI